LNPTTVICQLASKSVVHVTFFGKR